ncbi:Glycosyl transferase [Chitinispirillum alkaliphilum]|nr:Glycosyl transferase [Chitinispirillum alkaliphilum]
MAIDISVIIPTYNCEKFISEAVESVLNQEYKPKEIIVVDDGSTDNTAQVLSKYRSNLIYIFQNNQGVSSARNMGIMQSTGEFLTFLDSDDIWLPEKLKVHVNSLKRYPNACAYILNMQMERNNRYESDFFSFRNLQFSGDGELYIKRPLCSQLKYQFAWVQNTMIRKKYLDCSALFLKGQNIFEDFDFFCRLALKGPWFVSKEIQVRVMRRTTATENLSNARTRYPEQSLNGMLGILEKLNSLEKITKTESRTIDKMIFAYRRELAKNLIQNNDLTRAKEVLKKNIDTNLDIKSILFLLYATSKSIGHTFKKVCLL